MSSTIQSLTKKLVNNPDAFTPSDAQAAIVELMTGRATSAQIACFLSALKLLNKDAEPEIVAACAASMLEFAVKLDFSQYEGLQDSLVDVVGTGGDGMNTFNVSTTAAIVVAGAGGKVAKFGNRAASSSSGSADILESLGCKITNVAPSEHVAQPRREMGIPTIFNLLGPLVNPARPKRVVIGVYSKSLGPLVIEALRLNQTKKAMVVHGAIGLDEVSPEGETFVWELENDIIKEYTVTPSDYGLPSHPISSVAGGTASENAETLSKLLLNEYEGPVLDFVLLNAATALYVSGIAKDLKEGVKLAKESITSGNAKRALDGFRDVSLREQIK
ncbi:7619_t:CDS:2 [Paraglomus occultum]|uniref:7619_t:CDS:1 n=1 Tax=Paraglomus occultum TaxID=144539 RepID=A0A9N9BX34_9GLOM|nr:7619_t:CDS:2 [Paraglomus occultum]